MPLEDYVARMDTASTLADRVNIVNEAISDKDVHVFGELLNHPNATGLSSESPQTYQLLLLFAYGTYSELLARRQEFPEVIDDAQLRKLRRLSVVEAARKQRSLSYQDLIQQLGLSSVQELEDLVIEMVTLGVLEGKLDQRNRRLHVRSAIGRDVPLEQLPRLIDSLQAWSDSCRRSLGLVCAEMEAAERRHAEASLARRRLEEQIEAERSRAIKEAAAAQEAQEAGQQAAACSTSSVKSMKKVRLSGKK